MSPRPTRSDPKGTLYAIAAYASWGFFPLFWKQLKHLDPLQIIAHRTLWSLVALSVMLGILRGSNALKQALSQVSTRMLFVTSLLVGSNWLIYIYGVNSGQIVETSLGYFINPLVNVLIGLIFFKEKLSRRQWVAILIAAFGVALLAYRVGHFPWIALTLAFTFATYAAIRKKFVRDSLAGTLTETLILAPVALVILFLGVSLSGDATFHSTPDPTHLEWFFLIVGGWVTAVPLIWFGIAGQRMPLSKLGVFQYIGPSIQFCIGVFIYKEAFDSTKATAFALIWIALGLFLSKRKKSHLARYTSTVAEG